MSPEWTPRLRGKIYCSPACGGGCTKRQHDDVLDLCKEVAVALNKGNDAGPWKPSVHENLGWYGRVSHGILSISIPRCDGCDFYATMYGHGILGEGLTAQAALQGLLLTLQSRADDANTTLTAAKKAIGNSA